MRRGTTLKRRTEKELVIERKMVTHHDVMIWDLDTCVGCQLGPKICPMDSLTHVEGTIVDGRLATKLLVDVDVVMLACPKGLMAVVMYQGKAERERGAEQSGAGLRGLPGACGVQHLRSRCF